MIHRAPWMWLTAVALLAAFAALPAGAQEVVSFDSTIVDSQVFGERWRKVEIGGSGHFVGLRENQSVRCWGVNSGLCFLPGPECSSSYG